MKVTTFLLAIGCATLAHARGVCDGAAFCGGIANAVCKSGYTCLDDPDDTCDPNNGGRDCSGCCVRLVIPEKSSSAAAPVDTCTMCGGIANIQCAAGFTCMDDTRDNCDPNKGGRDCSGCCVRLVIPETRKPAPVVDTCTMCGGIANIQCDAGFTCMDDTRDNCDPNKGGRDCSGCCVRLVVPETKKPAPVADTCTMCGGIANIQCAAGFTCMDDTRDNCDPNNGGRDCSGCCVRLVVPEH